MFKFQTDVIHIIQKCWEIDIIAIYNCISFYFVRIVVAVGEAKGVGSASLLKSKEL